MNRKIPFYLIQFTLCLVIFSCKEEKNDIFTTYDEISEANGNEKEIADIVTREKENYSNSKSEESKLIYRLYETFLIKDNAERGAKLYELEMLNKDKNEDLSLICNYELAEILQQSSSKFFLKFLNKAIYIENKNHSKKFLPHLLHLKGKYYYKYKNYNTAIVFYKKAFELYYFQKNYIYQASMLNNIGLCFDKMNNFALSGKYFNDAIETANKDANQSQDNIIVDEILLNIAQSNFIQKKYDIAEPIFERFFFDYTLKQKINFYYLNFANRLIDIYLYKKESNKIESLIGEIKKNKFDNIKEQIMLNRIFSKYYLYKKNNEQALVYLSKLIQTEDEFKKSNNEEKDILSSKLEDKLFENIKIENNAIINDVKKKHYIIFIILLFLLISVFYYYHLEKTKSKNRKDLIEKEFLFQKEKIKNQKLLIEIKSNAEQKLLEKIKDIKNKNRELPSIVEEIFREIHLNINNLLEINKRNSDLFIESNIIDYDDNINYIKNKFPQLTDLEIRLCNYYHLKISSKEISVLENLSEGTIRVYRNKIKKKMGLSPETDLYEFLKSIE